MKLLFAAVVIVVLLAGCVQQAGESSDSQGTQAGVTPSPLATPTRTPPTAAAPTPVSQLNNSQIPKSAGQVAVDLDDLSRQLDDIISDLEK